MKYDVFGDESPVDPSVLQPAKMLQWKISPSTAADIQTASNSMNKWVDATPKDSLVKAYKAELSEIGCFYRLAENTDLICLTFTDFGKDFCKSVKLSPDGFIQMAIQLAFYR